jgi:hypothetical protein
MAFIYEQFLRSQYAGFSVAPGSWVSLNLALVNTNYTPDAATDTHLSDIPGGGITADGHTGTFPTFTLTFNGSGAAPEAGIQLAILTNSWGVIGAGAEVDAVVLYAILSAGPVTALVAYYDDWGGLPFVPNGTPIMLASLPTPLQMNGVNMVITASA